MGFHDLMVEADNDATFGGDKLVPSPPPSSPPTFAAFPSQHPVFQGGELLVTLATPRWAPAVHILGRG